MTPTSSRCSQNSNVREQYIDVRIHFHAITYFRWMPPFNSTADLELKGTVAFTCTPQMECKWSLAFICTASMRWKWLVTSNCTSFMEYKWMRSYIFVVQVDNGIHWRLKTIDKCNKCSVLSPSWEPNER